MGGGAFLVLPSPCLTTRMITASFFPLLKLWDRCAFTLVATKLGLTINAKISNLVTAPSIGSEIP